MKKMLKLVFALDDLPLVFSCPSHGYDHVGEKAGYSDESGDMFSSDVENELG